VVILKSVLNLVPEKEAFGTLSPHCGRANVYTPPHAHRGQAPPETSAAIDLWAA
jgi:hypothetical protein